MAQFLSVAFGLLFFLSAGIASAQVPQDVKDAMHKNILLEKDGNYRDAYAGWNKVLKHEALLRNLSNENVQKVYYKGYFYSSRTLYKTAILDPKIKDQQKLIDGAAKMIVNLEFFKSKEGWKIVGPLFEALLKKEDSAQLKKAYDKLKADRNATNLSAPPN